MFFNPPPKPNCCNGYCDGKCITHTIDGVCVGRCEPIVITTPGGIEHNPMRQHNPKCASGITCAECCGCIELSGTSFCYCVGPDHKMCGVGGTIAHPGTPGGGSAPAPVDPRVRQVSQGGRVPGLSKTRRRALRRALR